MMVQFSSNESATLDKQIDSTAKTKHTSPEDINFLYETDRCAEWIRTNNFQKVCLQFPDFLLPDSTEVAQRLQSDLKQTVYVMGDTAYESCCIDYVAAAHVDADAIIHFGPVCFSQASNKIPCLTIYEKEPLNLSRLKDEYVQEFGQVKDAVVMLVDTPYIVRLGAIKEMFRDYPNLQICPIDHKDLDLRLLTTVFLGGNLRKILNLQLSLKPKELHYCDPKLEPLKFINYQQDSKVLKRRYFLVEKIKDSNTIGIVIGTLAVRNYLRVIERIKKLIRASHKKYYIISVGKPTIAKLANFPELDVYVIITCAMNEIYDSRDFYKPIVTPFDIELALNPDANDSQFSYDYNTYLPSKDLGEDELEKIRSFDDDHDVSLITGKVRSARAGDEVGGSDAVGEDTQVAVRTAGTVALNASFGAGFLSERSWKGLEQKLGEDEPELATEGRRGLAQGYENEKS